MLNERGITLIELILFMLVVAIALPPLLIAASQAVHNTVVSEIIFHTVNLAEEKMEEIKSLGFEEIVNHSGTLESPFEAYNFSVSVSCVTPPDYETTYTCDTTDDYKRVTVTVSNSIIPEIESTLVSIISRR